MVGKLFEKRVNVANTKVPEIGLPRRVDTKVRALKCLHCFYQIGTATAGNTCENICSILSGCEPFTVCPKGICASWFMFCPLVSIPSLPPSL